MATALASAQDRAATRIQARVRGAHARSQHQRLVRGVTRLQARQRGRFTRREFARLLRFHHEHEAFAIDAQRRQMRLWQHAQELYFLQHTTAEQLEAIRRSQAKWSARRIQRCWRASRLSSASGPSTVSLRQHIRAFDPFQLGSSRLLEPRQDQQSAVLVAPLYGDVPSKTSRPSAIIENDAFATRRKIIQERIKRKSNERPSAIAKPKAPNRRRELYESVESLQRTTHQRLQTFTREHRESREERWLQTAQLTASCFNRLQILQQAIPAQEEGGASANPAQKTRHMLDQAKGKTEEWSQPRKQRAWIHHDQLVENVLAKQHWYETTVAGSTRDIRLMHSRSPFDEHVWTWPRQDQAVSISQEPVEEPASAVDVFTFGLADLTAPVPPPVLDRDASQWWRAHCTQSQLQLKSEGQPLWTSEALMNPDLHRLALETKRRAEAEQHAAAVQARADRLQQDVNQQIRAIELQIELNTRMTREMAMRKLAAKKRLSREQQAAVNIQRHVRGAYGRKKAEEIRCEFFVMVRGRAIRKGKCEECGAQPAVLQCKECEESVHFCPMCWVHVHSTRRRKMHVAIPMTAPVMAKEPAPEVKVSTRSSQRPRAKHVAQTTAFKPEHSAPVTTLVPNSLEPALSAAGAAEKAESVQLATEHVTLKPSKSGIDNGTAADAVPEFKQAPTPKPMPKFKSEDRSVPVAARSSLKARHSALAKAREEQKSEASPPLNESEAASSVVESVVAAASPQSEQPQHEEREVEAPIAISQPTAIDVPAASERQEPSAPTQTQPSASELGIVPATPEPQPEEAASIVSVDVVDPNADPTA